jgi:hypothetical protein
MVDTIFRKFKKKIFLRLRDKETNIQYSVRIDDLNLQKIMQVA